MRKVLIIATSPKTRGGITSLLKLVRRSVLWDKYRCFWLSTHRDAPGIVKMAYFIRAILLYPFLLPFFDVVHINFSVGFSLTRKYVFFKIARVFCKTTVIHLHCGSQLEHLWNRKYDYMFKHSDRALVLSQGIKDVILRKIGAEYSEKITVLYNPCPKICINRDNDSHNILFLGRLVKEKGYRELLEAFSSVHKRHPDWTLTICGTGEMEKAKSLGRKYGCEEAVSFPGWVSDEEKEGFLSSSSILCLPSYEEGFPISILEAWSAGVPVIASSVGAIPELLQDGDNGLLVQPRDALSLENAIEKLVSEPALRQTLSENARHMAETELSEREFILKLDRIYAEKMKIGILSHNYAAKRLFLNKVEGAVYKDIRPLNWFLWKNVHLWFLRAIHKLKMSPEEIVAKLFYDYKAMLPTGCDILHFFNCINHGSNVPWVVSVESGVPWSIGVTRAVESRDADLSGLKNDPYVCERIKNLASDNCLALLPLSSCSYDIQMEILKQFPEYEEKIRLKTYTLHPAQELKVKDVGEKGLSWSNDEEFIFIYVGKNYFRKGGRESVEVLAELHKKYNNFKLILISAMEPDESRYMRTAHDEEDARKLIAKSADWIEFHEGLPNELVLEKLKKAHVCLLPTWMDTYAYSVLESQACGTPLITTAQRALNETNNESVGWLIEVPVNRLNNPLHLTRQQQDIFSRKLSEGLYEKCEYVLTHREEVKLKSMACLERIAALHDPDDYARKLKLVYDGKVKELIQAGQARRA